MVFPIAGGTQDTSYEISNSLRFNEPDGAHLSRTPSSAGNRKTWTFSCWIKRSGLQADVGDFQAFFTAGSGSNRDEFFWEASNGHYDKLAWYGNYGGTAYGVRTSSVFRDVSAWYHVVWVGDTTQGTEANRLKVYINGTQQTLTEFNSGFLSQNTDMYFNNTTEHEIGSYTGETQHFAGYMSEINHIDGQALDPTYFAETNSNGVWIPKEYTGSYGTNGFFMQFKQTGTSANSSGMGADTSGNDHHFTPSNLAATDVTTDTPTNNFATLNPLDQSNSYAQNDATSGTFSEGNCNFSSAGQIGGSERYYNTTATIAIPSSGKWYWEAKPNNGTNGLGFRWVMGLLASNHGYSNANFTEWTEAQGQRGAYKADGTVWYNNSQISSGHGTPSVNDIISFKYDADNRDFFVAVNGTYINSGNAVLTSSNITATDFLLIFLQNGSDGNVATAMNFGNAPFSISSGNSDANGHGNFEYAVPSGYFALCTKNLAETG